MRHVRHVHLSEFSWSARLGLCGAHFDAARCPFSELLAPTPNSKWWVWELRNEAVVSLEPICKFCVPASSVLLAFTCEVFSAEISVTMSPFSASKVTTAMSKTRDLFKNKRYARFLASLNNIIQYHYHPISRTSRVNALQLKSHWQFNLAGCSYFAWWGKLL